MPVECRAAIFVEPNKPLVIDTIEVADPGPTDVLIRLDAASLCHSDLSFLEGKFKFPLPAIFGHEGIGEVVSAGGEVTSVAPGDTVIPYIVPDCGKCAFCLTGKTNMCAEMGRSMRPGFPTWFRWKGQAVPGFQSLGTFSEYLVVPHDQVQKVNPAAEKTTASCIGCGVTTGVGAATLAAKIEAGSSVVIFGMGGVGLATVQGAKISGAKTIIAVDVVPEKESVARAMGATHFLNGKDADVVAETFKLTGLGADYAFDCVGHPALIEQAIACTSPNGQSMAVSVGMVPDSSPVDVKLSKILGRTWHYTMMGGAKRQDVGRFVDWFVDGKLNLDNLVSDEITLDQINDGFGLMKQGKTSRAVIRYR